MLHKQKYEFQTEQGSMVEVKIEARIKRVDRTDLEEILREFASCTHNFYLSLGRKISNDA